MKDCPKQTFVFIKFTYSSPSPHISLSLRQLDQRDEILDRSFDCRKHCHPHHSEACRDHWLGAMAMDLSSFVVFVIAILCFMGMSEDNDYTMFWDTPSPWQWSCAISIRWGFWLCSFLSELHLSHLHMFNEDYYSLFISSFVCWFVVVF